jgi:hypothetical protein
VGAFSVLKELVVVLPDCLADHFGSLVPGIEKALNVSFLFSKEISCVDSFCSLKEGEPWCCGKAVAS